jgi:hypothetical protein
MPATVIADVFSGLPNPQWTIAGDLLVQLKLMLAQLSLAHGAVPEPPGLGYRGLILEFSPDEGIAGPLRVFGGYVVGPHDTWIDPGHALERWLLETGIRLTNADVLKEILDEVH